MSRTDNATRNIAWGLINNVLLIILPFLTRTVMIYTMGMEYVGLGGLFSSLLQVLSFAELGIGNAMVFSMYKPIAVGDVPKVNALLSLYKKIYKIIGIVIIGIGLLIIPFLRYLVAGDLPEGISLYRLYAIYLVNNALGYLMFAYRQSLFTASQRIDVISKVNLLLHIVSSALQIGILLTTHNYYFYVMIIPVITCIQNICVFFLSKKAFPEYDCEGIVDSEEVSTIKTKVKGMVFQKIGGIVLTSVDTLVISAYLGLNVLGLYQNYYYPITALFGLLMVIMQSIIATVGNSIVTESVEKNYADFKKFNMMYIWVVIWFATCLLCIYQPFMEIWVHKEAMFGMEMVILFVVYFFAHKWCDMLYVYQEACGIWWENRFIPLTAAVVNLIVNIILVNIIGLPGILISTIIAVVLIYDTGYAGVLFKTYFREQNGLLLYWKRQVVYFFSGGSVAVVTFWLCSVFAPVNPWARLALNAGICTVVPNVLIAVIWHPFTEFQSAKMLLKKIAIKRLDRIKIKRR